MNYKNVLILGNTLKEDKYAFKIKHNLLKADYNVFSAPYEISNIDDIKEDIDVLDICINPNKAIEILNNSNKNFKACVIQPGAESNELFELLNKKNISYIEGCMLVGLRLYKGIEVD